MPLVFKKEQPKTLEEKLDTLTEQVEKITAPSVQEPEVDTGKVETVLASEDTVDTAAAALQKQIDALKKSEEIQRNRTLQAEKDRDAAVQKANERATESVQLRKETYQSQADAIGAALAGAISESESAKRDIKNAIANGDADAQADAYERMATARANIAKLEDGKFEIEQRIKTAPDKPETIEKTQPQDNTPGLVKDWISRHPDFIQEPRKNDKIKALHWDALDEGLSYGSQEYVDFIDTKLGFKKAPAKEETDDDDEEVVRPQQRNSIVSAPVSREAPSTPDKKRDGKINLNQEQRDIAAAAGITEAEYAKQLIKINKMKANGSYGDRQ